MPMLFSENEQLFAFLDDICVVSDTGRIGDLLQLLQRELWNHARISLHLGKTKVWNRAGICQRGCEEMQRAAVLVDPNARVWRGDTSTPPSEQSLKILGTPVGQPEYLTAKLQELSAKQLVKALSSLCDTPSQLKFTRLPGCGAHSQERQHCAGKHLAHRQSSSPRVWRLRPGETTVRDVPINFPRSDSIFLSRKYWGLFRCWQQSFLGRSKFVSHTFHVDHSTGDFCWAQAFLGASVVELFPPQTGFLTEENQGSRVASGVAQRSSSEESCPRNEGAGPPTQCHPLHSPGPFKSVHPHGPLVAGRTKHLARMFFPCFLFYFEIGLQGHGESPVVNGSMFVYESGSGVGPSINQEGSIAWIAPAAVLTPIGQTVAQSVLWGISFSARYVACVVVLVSVLAVAAHLRSLALSVVPAPGVRTSFGSFFLSVVPASGTLDVPAGLSVVRDRPLNQRVLPSCDFCKLHKHFSVRRIGTVTLLAIFACSVTPVLWQIGLDGVRVGEASHPGPTHLASEGAPIVSNISESVSLVPVPSPGVPAARPGAPAPGSPVAQVLHPYAAPPPPPPASLSRPGRFCTFSRPHGSPSRLSGSPAPRSPVRPSSIHALDQTLVPGQPRVFCPIASCPDHAHPSHGWLSFQSMRPHIEAHLSGQLLGDVSSEWLRSQGLQHMRGLSPHPQPQIQWAVLLLTSGVRVRSSVPAAARDAWSRCLIIALADNRRSQGRQGLDGFLNPPCACPRCTFSRWSPPHIAQRQ